MAIPSLGIQNANRFSVYDSAVGTPNMREVLSGWMRPLALSVVTQEIVNYEVKQIERPLAAMGVIQPLSGQQLALKPEGQRAWNWRTIHTTIDLQLKPDDVILIKGERNRVMEKKSWETEGFFEYHVVNDWKTDLNANS